MAKRKTPKVDLNVRPEKVTTEQLQRIQSTIDGINRAQLDMGMLEVKKHNILHTVSDGQKELVELQQELKEQYGTFDINIQDGTIKYNENVETNKED